MRLAEILNRDERFQYQLLSRMQMDCKYFLGNGRRYGQHLWANSVEEHIRYMRAIFYNVSERPEWITKQELKYYEKNMKLVKSF